MRAAVLACGLAAGVAAMPEEEWVEMPNGMLFHRDCVHRHDGDFSVHHVGAGRERVSTQSGIIEQEPCPYPPRRKERLAAPSSYYSSWVAYGVAAATPGDAYTFMNSTWTVPPEPKSRGPTGLSSIYLFNGLEDGGGHFGNSTLILQPVVSYGKSGCVLDPLAKWNYLSFLVSGSGRAHCGKKIAVKPGDLVVGTMVDKGNNVWDVVSKANGETSTYTATLAQDTIIDAAYATLEGMIIYNCDEFPGGGGSTKFSGNQLTTRSGKAHGKWSPIVRHDECGQHVQIDGDDVTVFY